MPADVNLGIDIEKKGSGDKEAAAGLELVAKAADDATDELRQLDRKLLETRAAMVAAGKTFAQTGDISPFKQAIKDQREIVAVRKSLTQLGDDSDKAAKRMKAAFEQALGDKKEGIFGFFKGGSISNALIPQMQTSGLQAGSAFAGGFREALIGLAGPIGLVVGPPLVAAIGASIAGATLGGLGLGAIAAGVALQFKSPLVHDAATDLGAYIKDRLTSATADFGPRFAAGLVALRRESEPLWDNLKAGLQSLQPYVSNLLVRLGEGLAKLGPGLQHALEAAGPVLGAISKNIPTLLNAINIFLDEVSKGGKGAAEAIDAIAKSVAALIAGLGFVIRGLSNAFDFMAQAGDKVTGILAKIPGIGKEWEALHNYVHGVATSFDETKLSADGATGAITAGGNSARTSLFATADAVKTLSDRLSTLLNQGLGVQQSQLGVASALATVRDTISSNTKSIDLNTEAGRANVGAILGAVSADQQLRESMIRAGASADYANRVFGDQIGQLEGVLSKAGFTKAQIDSLIGTYRQVPPSVNTNVNVIGVDSATERVIGLSRALNSLHDRVVTTTLIQNTITGETRETVHAGPRIEGFGGIVAAARGLIANSPTVVYGERTLPEAYIPARNSGISQARADSLLGTAASWWGRRLVPAGGGGGGTVQVELSWAGASAGSLEDAITGMITARVVNAGGSVQAAFGRRGH